MKHLYCLLTVIAVTFGKWGQTLNFEVANASENPTPAISGVEGKGVAVHASCSVQAYPTFILIGPDGNI